MAADSPAVSPAGSGTVLAGIGVCAFDAYGTLFDVHSPAERLREQLGEVADRLSALWRSKQLEYTWLRSLMGRHADFWQVTGEALDYAMAETGLTDPDLCEQLMLHYLHLDAYPDAAPLLQMLQAAGIRTAILSNGAPAMLAAAARAARLEDRLNALLSVEAVGVYKPHPAVYRLAEEHFGLPRQRIAFVSANGWDAAGAAAFGFRVVWLNRTGRRREALPTGPEAEITALSELPGLLGLLGLGNGHGRDADRH